MIIGPSLGAAAVGRRSNGELRRAVGRTHHRPPTIAALSVFAPVRREGGTTYSTRQFDGITFGTNSVAYDKVALGPAVLDATMVRTTCEN